MRDPGQLNNLPRDSPASPREKHPTQYPLPLVSNITIQMMITFEWKVTQLPLSQAEKQRCQGLLQPLCNKPSSPQHCNR